MSASGPPLRFANEEKLREQMRRRGWTDQQIREAMATPAIAASGKNGPALRYVHPVTGRSVVVDAATGEVFHVGGAGSSMNEPQTIYVRLLEEGVDVWRPAPAYQVGASTFILLRPSNFDGQMEQWEFPPGTAVETQMRQLSGGAHLVAVRAAKLASRTA